MATEKRLRLGADFSVVACRPGGFFGLTNDVIRSPKKTILSGQRSPTECFTAKLLVLEKICRQRIPYASILESTPHHHDGNGGAISHQILKCVALHKKKERGRISPQTPQQTLLQRRATPRSILLKGITSPEADQIMTPATGDRVILAQVVAHKIVKRPEIRTTITMNVFNQERNPYTLVLESFPTHRQVAVALYDLNPPPGDTFQQQLITAFVELFQGFIFRHLPRWTTALG